MASNWTQRPGEWIYDRCDGAYVANTESEPSHWHRRWYACPSPTAMPLSYVHPKSRHGVASRRNWKTAWAAMAALDKEYPVDGK